MLSIEPNSFNFARFVKRKAKVNTRKIDQTKAEKGRNKIENGTIKNKMGTIKIKRD